MKKDIKTFIEECSVCQENKSKNTPLTRLLQPLPIPHQVENQISLIPTPVNDFGEVMPNPEMIMDRRMKKLGKRVVIEVLVKWSRATNEDNTWEILDKLRGLYTHLVGKVL